MGAFGNTTATQLNLLIPLGVANGGTGNSSVDTIPTASSTKMCTSGGIYTALSGKAPTSHSQAASTITAGTLAGQVKANATSVATVTTEQIRNMSINSSDTVPSENGAIAWKYA